MQFRIPTLHISLLLFFVYACSAQDRSTPRDAAALQSAPQQPIPGSTHLEASPSNYELGPGDQVTFFVTDAEEISNKPVRIDMRGDINLPLAGRVHCAGLTAQQVETEVESRLQKFLRDPEVVVSITEFRSQPVSVLGAVNNPGVHQLEGQKNLYEVLSLAGGLRPDAGNTVRVTRDLQWGRIPLPNASDDATGKFSVASISVKSIMDASDPVQNIAVKPRDVISVSKEDIVYVVGAIHKPGGFPLGEKESLSALQVLSLGEGLEKAAAPDKARIMRAVPGSTNRTEIPVNLKKLMAGKGSDVALKANDILFVPTSAAKNAAARTAEAAVQVVTGMAVYGRF